MKHIQQPTGSNLCGHACLAMILGLTLDEGVERMGHGRSTRTRELVKALGDKVKDSRLIPVRQRDEPTFAILKVTWNGKPRRSHFVVRRGDRIHDPSYRYGMSRHNWDLFIKDHGRVTSALELV